MTRGFNMISKYSRYHGKLASFRFGVTTGSRKAGLNPAPSSRYQYENSQKTKILPFFHLGLNEVYPPVGPHERTFRSDKAITMMWGEPISFENEIEAYKATNFEDELSMIESITKRLQEILYKMREECESLHLAHLEELGDQTQIDEFLEKKKDRLEPISKTDNFEKIYFEN